MSRTGFERTGSQPSPFRGLVPYSEADAPFFFGRSHEGHVVANSLLAMPQTVLYGPSGVGKSSLLYAGVVPHLQQLARQNLDRRGEAELAVVIFGSWSGDALGELWRAVQEAVAPLLPDGSVPLADQRELADVLRTAGELLGGTVLVVLDQFEEYFLYHAHDRRAGSLSGELVRAMKEGGARANFLLSIREDALARIDQFKGDLPNVFDHMLRVDALDRYQAREAITKPLEQYNVLSDGRVTIEPELVDAVVTQLTVGSVSFGVGDEASDVRVEAPLLQVVMSRVWEEELALGSTVLRAETLHQLGGAETIFLRLVDRALETLPLAEQELAARAFHFLVTPSGTKIALSGSDLATFCDVPLEELEPVLAKLSSATVRILRAVQSPRRGDPTRFEIFHDLLAHPVLDWSRRHTSESRVAVLEREWQASKSRVAVLEWRFRLALVACLVLLAALLLLTALLVEASR